jgi:quinol-cytochrome oxidoreductase complex cytochrome b subunit
MVQQVARRFVGNWLKLKQNVIIRETVGGNTLTRFHATHVRFLPAAIVLVLVLVTFPGNEAAPVSPVMVAERSSWSYSGY